MEVYMNEGRRKEGKKKEEMEGQMNKGRRIDE